MVTSRRNRASRRWLKAVAAVAVIIAAIFVLAGAATAQTAASRPAPNPVLGLQDGSVNLCDGYEKVVSSDVAVLEPGALRQAPDYDAARTAVDSAYFPGLHVATVRFSPPWDVADPSLVHQGKSEFAANARGALRVEQACLSYWLAALAVRSQELGVTIIPQIAFKPDYNYVDNPAHPTKILVPSLAAYRKAVSAFMRLYVNARGCTATMCPMAKLPPGVAAWAPMRRPGSQPGQPPAPAAPTSMARVRIISPWGEPDDFAGSLDRQGRAGFTHLPQNFYLASDHNADFGARTCAKDTASNPARCGSSLAAKMWVTVHDACSVTCSTAAGGAVIAGDFGPYLSGGRQMLYLANYDRNLNEHVGSKTIHYRPDVWGYHPYGDLIAEQKHLQYGTKLPPTETGAFVKALARLGYHSGTSVWLNEITVSDPGKSSTPVTAAQNAAWFNAQGRYLLTTLPRTGSPYASGMPTINRIYYLAFSTSKPSLVSGAQSPDTPYPPGPTGTETAPYTVFANRPNPR
jgi:hypothetical protein